jgi:cob(I)alamin adenosyltransferase
MKELNMKTGLIQVYTGNGKGKTTAAIGLAIRAAGAGLKVAFYQFLKGGDFPVSEEKILNSFTEIDFIRFNQTTPLFDKKISVEALAGQVKSDLEIVSNDIANSGYDMIVLDELTHLINFNLVDEKQIMKMLDSKPETMEIVITGRQASAKLIKKADLVTEMKEIKHPFQKGLPAQPGIDF